MTEPEPAREVNGDEALAALCGLEDRHVCVVVTGVANWTPVAQLVGRLGAPRTAGAPPDEAYRFPVLESLPEDPAGGPAFWFPVERALRATIDDEPGPGRHGDGAVFAEFADWRVTVRPTGRA